MEFARGSRQNSERDRALRAFGGSGSYDPRDAALPRDRWITGWGQTTAYVRVKRGWNQPKTLYWSEAKPSRSA